MRDHIVIFTSEQKDFEEIRNNIVKKYADKNIDIQPKSFYRAYDSKTFGSISHYCGLAIIAENLPKELLFNIKNENIRIVDADDEKIVECIYHRLK